jgi:hypothetical protein
MRTLQEMLEAEKNRVRVPTMRFKDFCQYIYEPLIAAEDTNLAADQKQALITEISIRVGDTINPTWPANYSRLLIPGHKNN